MGRRQKQRIHLNYESVAPPAERLYFGCGGLSLTLALMAAAVTMGVFLAPYRMGMSRGKINMVLRMTMLMSGTGLICGGTGLFRPKGKSAAILGIVLSLVNLGFIPAFIVN